MRDLIRDKIALIEELYPNERVDASKKRISKIWAKELPEDRLPFCYMPCVLNYYDIVYPKEERLSLALEEFITRSFIDDDFVPTLFPGCRQNSIPSLFGADDSNPRIIHCEADIKNLPDPEIKVGSVAWEMLEMMRYMLEETEGAFQLNIMDMQGPVEVAAKIWGYEEFFITAYTEPELCHALMNKLSLAFILLWEEQKKIAGDLLIPNHLWGWNWAPKDIGASLSSDGLVMVSNEFAREFYNPSTNLISDYFGGITVHSCGDFSAAIPSQLELRNLRAIHAGQMNLFELNKAGITEDCTVIAFSSCNDLDRTMQFAKNKKLPCFLSILDFWENIPANSWDDSTKKYFQTKHQNQLRAAKIMKG